MKSPGLKAGPLKNAQPFIHIDMKKKALRYLLEIVIIFVGITLSFIFEEYRDGRKSLQNRKELIQSLIVDLEEKANELKRDSAIVRGFIQSIDTCLNLAQHERMIDPVHLKRVLLAVNNDFSFFSVVTPSYMALSSSEAWQQLPDSLRRGIFNFYDIDFGYVAHVYGKLTEYVSHAKKMNYKTLISLRKSVDSFSNEEEQQKAIVEIESKLKDEELRNALWLIRNQYAKCLQFENVTLESERHLHKQLMKYLQSLQ